MAFNKRGQIVALAFGMVLIIALSLISVYVWKALDGINTEFQLQDDLSNETKETFNNITTSFPSIFDGITILVIMGVWMLAMVLSWQASDNPMLAVLSFILLGILMFVSMILGNVWSEVVIDDASIIGAFPLTNFFLNNYLMVILAMGATIILVTITRSTNS